MSKASFLLWSILLLSITHCGAQDWLGTKASYQPQQRIFTPAPAGYHAIFINHVGRHGSRYMTKAGEDSLLFTFFSLAQNQNGLTPIGKKWQTIVNWLVEQQQGKYADITLLGRQEHHGISKRMLHQFPDLFSGKDIDVWYTSKARTLQSAKGFTSSFPKNQTINWKIQPESSETMLRFYDYSPELESYQNSKTLLSMMDTLKNSVHFDALATHIADRFIKISTWEKWFNEQQKISIKGKAKVVSKEMFATAFADFFGVLQSTKIELAKSGISLSKLGVPFTEDEKNALGRIDDLGSNWEKGPSINNDGIQVRIAMPLLANIVATSDSLISGNKKEAGVFRFTHAEAISPLATLIGIKQADSTFNSVTAFGNSIWDASKIIPMAANIQWIFYSNGTDILVKFLLNEKESEIPIRTDLFPYYHWNDVKAYLVTKLPQDYNSPTFNWVDYLKQLH